MKPIPDDCRNEIAQLRQMPEQCKDLVVNDKESCQYAADIIRDAKVRGKRLDEWRKKITRPMDEAKKAVMDLFRPAQDAMADVEKIIKPKIAKYNADLERERARKLAEAEEKARKEREELEELAALAAETGDNDAAIDFSFQADSVVAEVPAFADEKISGVSIRKTWVGDVYDIVELCKAIGDGRIPPGVIDVKQSEINKLANAWGTERDFAGIKFTQKCSVVSR